MAQPHNPAFEIDHVVSGASGIRFPATSLTNSDLLIQALAEDQRVFSFERYREEIHPPVPIPFIHTVTDLEDTYQRCLDMPIRLAGESQYALPEEWKGLLLLIQDIVTIEHAHNPNWRDYNTYITVDSKEVTAKEQQRHGGLHVDGFQGERITEKTKVTRNYVVTTNGGTRFYPQRFVVADPAKFNVFQGFDLQVTPHSDVVIAEENIVHFMNAYSVHESGFALRDGQRTFLRVTFDLKEFDREGNTHNSMLDYDWDMVKRSVWEEVETPRLTDIVASPYA